MSEGFAKKILTDAIHSEGNEQKVNDIRDKTVDMIVDRFLQERMSVENQMTHTPYHDLDGAQQKRVDEFNFNFFSKAKDKLGKENPLIKDMQMEKFILLYNPSPDFEMAKSSGDTSKGDAVSIYSELHNSDHKSMQASAIKGMEEKIKNANTST